MQTDPALDIPELDHGDDATAATADTASASKPKRVRTGCLTCRERHLKCDEGLPSCLNCRKSNRECKRGIRLNFIDTNVQTPPTVVPTPQQSVTSFVDESRDIASEYKGGLSKYAPYPEDNGTISLEVPDHGLSFDPYPVQPPTAPMPAHEQLPPIQGILPEHYPEEQQEMVFPQQRYDKHQEHPHHMHSHTNSTHSGHQSYGSPEDDTSVHETRDFLNTQEEVLFMQVFVEEVGLWMDSMDPQKHFSRLLPFHALSEPMLLHAFLACGARHLSLVNAKYTEDKALHYYDTATRFLLQSLQNPERDTVICATTAVILNVYEIMCERALQRMNHIAGARALIKECGWNARSSGIGAACFWLNVGMEILSCLHFNWQIAWDPDDWGVDMNMVRETQSGQEEMWTHRMLYIVAKVANFRASIPRTTEQSPQQEQRRLSRRYQEWNKIKDWADRWNECIPRTMHPMGYLYPYQTISQSAFPEVWLIKRTTIVARLFYHTAMTLLAQINPIMSKEVDEMRDMQHRHANQTCGIVAHVKDRGVASVALRSLAIAAECLTVRREQEEVLQIFDKIRQETGWRVGFLHKELKEKWGWQEDPPPVHIPPVATMQTPSYQQQYPQTSLQQVTLQAPIQTTVAPAPQQQAAPAAAQRRPPMNILNPLLATADFSMPQHPYQSYYVAPNSISHHTQFTY